MGTRVVCVLPGGMRMRVGMMVRMSTSVCRVSVGVMMLQVMSMSARPVGMRVSMSVGMRGATACSGAVVVLLLAATKAFCIPTRGNYFHTNNKSNESDV